MHPFQAAPLPCKSLAPRARRASLANDAKDFALLVVFVSAFLSASYLALWKPLIAQLF
jgi:hypothetical protein